MDGGYLEPRSFLPIAYATPTSTSISTCTKYFQPSMNPQAQTRALMQRAVLDPGTLHFTANGLEINE